MKKPPKQRSRSVSGCVDLPREEARPLRDLPDLRDLEGLVVDVDEDDAGEQQDRAGERVEEELDRRVLAPGTAPDPDQEVHREEHQLPEHVEEEEVERGEDAHHPREEEEVHRVVALRALLDVPRRDRRDERDERGQEQERDADPVDAHVVADVEGGDPGPVLHEAVALGAGGGALAVRVALPDRDRREEGRDAGEQVDPAARPRRGLLRHEQAEDDPRQRQEHRQGEDVRVHGRGRIASAYVEDFERIETIETTRSASAVSATPTPR